MRAPVVHHPAYVTPLPASHRFPMPKFARLLAACGRPVCWPTQEFVPEPAPRAWLELAHDAATSPAVLEQRLDAAAIRRLGLPMSPVLALRSRCAVAGTLLTARLALEHGLACNTAGGSHHAFAGFGAGFCVFNDVAVAARLLLDEGLFGGAGRRSRRAPRRRHGGDPRRRPARVHALGPLPGQLSGAKAAERPRRGARRRIGDADYLATIDGLLPPLLDRVRPDLVFYNAGVDPHDDDRLGRLASATPVWPRGSAWCSSRAAAAACRSPASSAAATRTISTCSPAATRCCTRRSRRAQLVARSDADDLARIQDVLRVERALEGRHHRRPPGRPPRRGCPSCRCRRRARRCRCRPWRCARRTRRLLTASARRSPPAVRVEQHQQVEIAVADMADDRRQQAASAIVPRLGDALGQPRDRHADIRGPAHAARPQRQGRRSRNRAAPARADCAPRAGPPTGSPGRHAPRRSPAPAPPAPGPRPRLPWNS